MIILVGLAAKNGILIVEFANQLRDEGKSFDKALFEAARVKLRPIAMTGITTAATSIPLIFSLGAGAETRLVIGVVVLGGVLIATLLTIYRVPPRLPPPRPRHRLPPRRRTPVAQAIRRKSRRVNKNS